MGYTAGSALGKEGSGRGEPVGLDIRRSRDGIGREDPHKEKRKREEIEAEKNMMKEEALMAEFGSRQKSQWWSRRVAVNFKKAKEALDQLEDKEIVTEKNEEDENGEQDEEEEITEEDVMWRSAYRMLDIWNVVPRYQHQGLTLQVKLETSQTNSGFAKYIDETER